VSRRSDASLVALLLTNRLTSCEAKPLTAKELWPVLRACGDDLGGLLDAPPTDPIAGVDASRIASLLGAATAFAFELERFETSGLWALSGVDDDYPPRIIERLGDAAPGVIFGAGPVGLLDRGGLGVVGSRDVSEAGAEVAREAARAAAQRGWVLVSGGARGVDQLSMQAAEQEGGDVVGILAEGLQRRLREPEVRQAIHDGRLCLCSPFKPDAGFNAGNAMARNKVVYAIADVTLVVASDEDSGGTWAGATEALRRGYGAVAVWRGAGEGPGNAALETKGARPVETVPQVFEASSALTSVRAAPTPSEQLGLDLN